MTFLDEVTALFNEFFGLASGAFDDFVTETFALLLFVLNTMISLLGGPF